VIFMLHHVCPTPPQNFEPNRILKVTPDFLDRVIRQVIEAGFEILSLDEVPARLASGAQERPFACFTFDDGYRDNRDYAYPIFKRYTAPFTIYVPTDFADGTGDLWWLVLEQVIRSADVVDVVMRGAERRFSTSTLAGKYAAFDEIYWWLRSIDEREARRVVAGLAQRHGIDVSRLCADLVMDWDELRALASDPLVTIGAHTRSHLALAKLDDAEARAEIAEGVRRIETELGRPCRHFAYPYGCELSAGPRDYALTNELGMATAVTTCKGLLHKDHAGSLTALPRVSLNGDYQDNRYVQVMLSGAPFALLDMARYLTPRRSVSGRN
jgi:peptidoglycan/xylan/chitin deacetylase (PgdA/CDA1 family)